MHRIIHCDGWYLSCPELNIEDCRLKSEDLFSAINDAKARIYDRVVTMKADFEEAFSETVDIAQY